MIIIFKYFRTLAHHLRSLYEIRRTRAWGFTLHQVFWLLFLAQSFQKAWVAVIYIQRKNVKNLNKMADVTNGKWWKIDVKLLADFVSKYQCDICWISFKLQQGCTLFPKDQLSRGNRFSLPVLQFFGCIFFKVVLLSPSSVIEKRG